MNAIPTAAKEAAVVGSGMAGASTANWTLFRPPAVSAVADETTVNPSIASVGSRVNPPKGVGEVVEPGKIRIVSLFNPDTEKLAILTWAEMFHENPARLTANAVNSIY